MILYVIRHGRAEAAAQGGDSERKLTLQGQEMLRRAAFGLIRRQVDVDRVFTSSILRAKSTADVLVRAVGWPPYETLPALSTSGNADEIIAALAGQGERIALIGHMPTVSELVGLLTKGQRAGGVPFATGAVAKLTFPAAFRVGAGTLAWYLTCEQLIEIGGSQAGC